MKSINPTVQHVVSQLVQEKDEVTRYNFFRQCLTTMSRFWRYSLGNQMLIFKQNPDASKIAGFNKWKKLGRNVKRGQESIKILAPVTLTHENDQGDEEEVVHFKPISLFDISQTYGEEILEEKHLEDKAELLNYLVEFCQAKDIDVNFEHLAEKGLYGSSSGGSIQIASDVSKNSQTDRLLHEIAHEILHFSQDGKILPKDQQEIQADATAYVVCTHFGLEPPTIDHLALQGSVENITTNLDCVARASRQIIDFVSFISGGVAQ
ncbi:hypothetical protein CL620_03395 [archaeon]|nr:hypothetical protein [archaeon]